MCFRVLLLLVTLVDTMLDDWSCVALRVVVGGLLDAVALCGLLVVLLCVYFNVCCLLCLLG